MFLIFPDPSCVAEYVSDVLIDKIRSKPEIVLGAATGGTMEPIYARFVAKTQQHQLDVSRLRSFNLDEYVGLAADHPKSYAAYMHEHLFTHVGFDESRHILPDGQAANLDDYCHEYSEKIRQIGGIDLQLLGVGGNGHIGFNEPGTPFDSRCHVVQLSERTRMDNSRFFAKDAIVPAHAITMGMQDIMESREILLVVTGLNKAEIMSKYNQHDVTEDIPFTLLKRHPQVTIVLDQAAASLLPERLRQRSVVAPMRA